MSVLGSYRLFNKLDNGSLSGAQLETLLAGSRELAEFKQLCDTTQAASALAASPTAVAAIGGSAIATQVVLDNRRNFDVVARQRLSAASVTFLEQFFITETVATGYSGTITNVFYNNGIFFLNQSDSSLVITDGLGKNSTPPTLNTNIVAMAFGNETLVAFRNTGATAFYSRDGGVYWSTATIPNASWVEVAFGNGVFVALANSTFITSPDGITWTTRTAPAGVWRSVVFGGGQFVAVGDNTAATSPDGITWTIRTIPTTIPAGSWISVTHGNGLFVAVAATTAAIATSPDGITWTSRTLPAGITSLYSVAFGGGLFVATHNGQAVYIVSKDGITWYRKASASAFPTYSRSIAYGNGLFLLNTTSTTGAVQRSISATIP